MDSDLAPCSTAAQNPLMQWCMVAPPDIHIHDAPQEQPAIHEHTQTVELPHIHKNNAPQEQLPSTLLDVPFPQD